MSALRILGILIGTSGILLACLGRYRWRRLGNGEWLLAMGLSLGLCLLGLLPHSLDALLALFAFEPGGGQRLIGLLIFAAVVQFVLLFVALARGRRVETSLDRLVRELAKREYRERHPQASGSVYVVIPAYNEAENIERVLHAIPVSVGGHCVKPLVVVDGATDRTHEVVERLDHAAVGYATNRGGGSALRAGYEIALEDGALVVVTLDADGQHRPEEISRLVEPILDGEADLVCGSRVLGSHESQGWLRPAGVVLFNWLISLLTLRRITDCSNGFRAIRASELSRLELRQPQFHTSELLIEALKKGLRVREVPVTVRLRSSGESKKPVSLVYGWGFAKSILATWLR